MGYVMSTSAINASEELELSRQVTNLCKLDMRSYAFALIERHYGRRVEAHDFLDRVYRQGYMSHSIVEDLRILVEELME